MITNEDLTKALLKLREQIQVISQETKEQIRVTSKETKEQIQALSQETNRQIKKTSEQMQETSERMKQTDKQIQALSQNIDGVNRSIGLEVEDFFYSSLKKNPKLADIEFDYIYQNDTTNFKGDAQEIDILLENGSSIGVVEVKNRVSQKSIDQLDKIMDNFFYFHPRYEEYRVIGALAGKIFPKHLQKKALKKGYSVLTQQGEHIEQINP